MSIFTKIPAYWSRRFQWDRAFPECNQKDNGMCRHPTVCEIQDQTWGRFLQVGLATVLNGPKELKGEDRQFCVFCLPSPCTAEEQSCPNGKVALMPGLLISEELDLNGEPYAIQRPVCSKSCSAGYWLTCLNSDQTQKCRYLSPTIKMAGARGNKDKEVSRWIQQNRMAGNGVLPVAMQLKFGLLIGECYPCLYANGLSHYGEPLLLADSNLVKRGYLDFYCPGGEQPPVRCPQGQVSKIDIRTNSSGPCDCMDGYYRVGADCQVCPAGFRCVFGGRTPIACPADTFSLPGAADCTQCTTDSGRCGPTQALTRCLSGFQDRDAYCMDCQNCRLPGITSGVPCQRASVVQVA